MKKKMIIIESCSDCPNLQEFGDEYQCSELFRNRLWKEIPNNIPKDCPLEDIPERR